MGTVTVEEWMDEWPDLGLWIALRGGGGWVWII